MVFNSVYNANKGVKMVIFLSILLFAVYFSSFICKVAQGSEETIDAISKAEYDITGQQVVTPSGENVTPFFTLNNGHFIFYYDTPQMCYWMDDTTLSTYGPFSADYMFDYIENHGTIYTVGNITLYYYSAPALVQIGGPNTQPSLIHIGGYDSDITYGISEGEFNILSILKFIWGVISFDYVPFPFNLFPVIFSMIIIFLMGYLIWCNVAGFIPSWL